MVLPAVMIGLAASLQAEDQRFPGVTPALKAKVDEKQIAGAVTAVVTPDGKVDLQTHGMADIAAQRPMSPDTLFWIASMTKPVTGVAVLMLQDAGKLKVSDPAANYLPEFASLKTPSGQPANLTITHLMTHTSGLGEAAGPAAQDAKTLADLVPLWLAAPMQYEPGAQWKYTQSGINAAARIVEVVSGQAFEVFLQERLFDPLGMKNTTFYPTEEQRKRLATGYAKDKATGALVPVPPRPGYGTRQRPPQGNGGLFSTGPDYARFCLMLLQGGTFLSQTGGPERRILSPEAMVFLTKPLTGGLPTGFFQNGTYGPRGMNYGWGLGTCILREPHPGVAGRLSPGSFGHGGAWGTQAWLDPVKGAGYLLMVQRADFPNSDGSEVRRAFQDAAADDLEKKR